MNTIAFDLEVATRLSGIVGIGLAGDLQRHAMDARKHLNAGETDSVLIDPVVLGGFVASLSFSSVVIVVEEESFTSSPAFFASTPSDDTFGS